MANDRISNPIRIVWTFDTWSRPKLIAYLYERVFGLGPLLTYNCPPKPLRQIYCVTILNNRLIVPSIQGNNELPIQSSSLKRGPDLDVLCKEMSNIYWTSTKRTWALAVLNRIFRLNMHQNICYKLLEERLNDLFWLLTMKQTRNYT